MRLVTVAEMQEAEKGNTAPRTEVRGSEKREPTIRRREVRA
jgi:hypothetical protein